MQLREYFSEYALIRERVRVEAKWFLALADTTAIPELPAPDGTERQALLAMAEISVEDAASIKTIERTTNHDVKAVEYFIKRQLEAWPALHAKSEFVHFACTSEDINNLAYGCMLAGYRQNVLLPACTQLIDALTALRMTMQKRRCSVVRMGRRPAPQPLAKNLPMWSPD